jgi:hypothetical protein
MKLIRLCQDELNEKLSADDFDVFRSQLAASGQSVSGDSSVPPIIPTKDLNTIRDNVKRLDLLETEL